MKSLKEGRRHDVASERDYQSGDHKSIVEGCDAVVTHVVMLSTSAWELEEYAIT